MISAVDFLRYCSCGDFPGESPKMVLIIEVFENGEIRIDGKSDSRYSASSLRRHFSAEEGKLTTILVGKDGGIKFRQIGKFHLGDIFSRIDKMPMRQKEMRNSFE